MGHDAKIRRYEYSLLSITNFEHRGKCSFKQFGNCDEN